MQEVTHDAVGEDQVIENDAQLCSAIEAICMVVDEPVAAERLANVFDVDEDRVTEAAKTLAVQYEEDGRGFRLVNVAGGWRFQSSPSQAHWVEHFVLEGQSARLSGAALETLAIVAYKQPISRAQIAAIRGVNVDGVLRTLQQRGYVTIIGEVEGGGQAQLFGTSGLFLEKLGISGLDDLPPLGDFIPDAELVELLERGLRPSATLDISDDSDVDLGDQIASDKVDLGNQGAQEQVDLGNQGAQEQVDLGDQGAQEQVDLGNQEQVTQRDLS